MIKFWGKVAAASVLLSTLGAQAMAADMNSRETPSYIRIGAGKYDVFGEDHDQTGTAHIEYIHGDGFVDSGFFSNVKPFFGFMGTGDSASYGYAGIRLDVYLGDNFLIAPSFAPGVYSNGDGKDLGNAIEFRSGIEFSYEFDNRIRIGSTLYHLSNAGIGKRNPGTEIVNVHFSIPITD